MAEVEGKGKGAACHISCGEPKTVTVTCERSGGAVMTIVINFEPATYSIHWDTDGDGKSDDTTSVDAGEIPVHADGYKEEDARYTYTFSKWAPELVPVTGAAIYKATYTNAAKTYTITFDSNGGSAVQPVTLGYGEKVDAPQNPTRTGYKFVGWTDLPETMPACDVTVAANWDVVTGTYSATIHGTFENRGASGGSDEGWIQIGTAKYGEVTHPAAVKDKVSAVQSDKSSLVLTVTNIL